MSDDFKVTGKNDDALFTLTIHRGDGMALLGMNWKHGAPPFDFVGFAIEYKEPDGERFFAVKNRLSFPGTATKEGSNKFSTRLAPIQKFRWVHFPRSAEIDGKFTYRVTPVFMNDAEELSYGEAQSASLELRRETYPGQLNVTFTRGFVASQAFVQRYGKESIADLLPRKASEGLTFKPSHPEAKEALEWMGFEARDAILELLDEAIGDKSARVYVTAFDLSEVEVFTRLKQLGNRLKIIIDDSKEHGGKDSAESAAASALSRTAGASNVKRQHMASLQHNKTIVVNGKKVKAAVCGSTNFSWRGFYVQNNNAVVVRGHRAIKPFLSAFDGYWAHSDVAGFDSSDASKWQDLAVDGIDAKIAFSPHQGSHALLSGVAEDVSSATSSVLYSLAFLSITPGPILETIKVLSKDKSTFVYGIADKKVGGLEIRLPNGKLAPVRPVSLSKNVPEPFKSEPTGGGGTRMHHKFIVVDFDKPTARVYFGSYNFSSAADTKNGENLLLIRDRRIAVSYAIEALRIFDHYHFRVAQETAKKAKLSLARKKPPNSGKEKPWWHEDFTEPRKIKDRLLFS